MLDLLLTLFGGTVILASLTLLVGLLLGPLAW